VIGTQSSPLPLAGRVRVGVVVRIIIDYQPCHSEAKPKNLNM